MPTVDERVAELLERVRAGALPARTRRPDELNEERVEEFVRTLQPHADAGRVKVLRQEIPWYARRTTSLGVFSFAAMFAAAIVLGVAVTWGLELLAAWRVTGDFIADHAIAVILGSIALQLAILARLYITSFPTWIDNAYKNLNRADNLGSLRRVASEPPETA